MNTITATPTATPMVIIIDWVRPSRKKLIAMVHSVQSRPKKFFNRISPVIHFCYLSDPLDAAIHVVFALGGHGCHL